MRKAFKFYRSYYDVMLELSEKDRLPYLVAIFEKQFLGKEPNLKGMANFAYVSQKHSIELQVFGYEKKTGKLLQNTSTQGGCVPPTQGGCIEEKEKEKEKENEKAI